MACTAKMPLPALPAASTGQLQVSNPTHSTQGFSQCPQFFAAGKPPVLNDQPKLRALCYDAFAVLHSGQSKTPLFVAQRLNKALVEDADEKRTNKFFSDARLPKSERAELDDYKRSGYSRGHMAPAGDMPTAQAMAQSFSLANMVPQSIKQNGGPWARIEKDTRSYAKRASGDVYIITGPVFAADTETVGNNQVRVPSFLYKLVYDAQNQRAWAHWQANDDAARVTQPISYEELVRRTGIEFLPGTALRSSGKIQQVSAPASVLQH
ncbi:DNA/RNA non-specific endonuclease [Comamonas sp. Y33R10-2]|uniref:DNA/RNA non-specific endonuclease n=1 Tax=Comamonas sp. Y33R10-2 TaxID=2853257 RepID=UPI00351D46A9